MSLLREITTAAIDSDVDLAVVLRKCKVLATRLGHNDLNKWVDQELNGYKSKDDLPAYRKVLVDSRGDFSSPGRIWQNLPIPPSCLPEKARDFATTAYLFEGVAAYATLSRQASKGTLHVPWPSDLMMLVSSRIYQGMNLMDAWQEIPAGALVKLLDTVRNRILSFALEIETEAPDAGEAAPGTKPLPQERVTQVFNAYILGGVSNIALGGSSFSQAIQQQIHPGDLNSLKDYLRTLGLTEEDLQELEVAVNEDEKPKDSVHLGKRVSNWIGKMTGKALTGAWNVASSAAADVLARAVRLYYGLEG